MQLEVTSPFSPRSSRSAKSINDSISFVNLSAGFIGTILVKKTHKSKPNYEVKNRRGVLTRVFRCSTLIDRGYRIAENEKAAVNAAFSRLRGGEKGKSVSYMLISYYFIKKAYFIVESFISHLEAECFFMRKKEITCFRCMSAIFAILDNLCQHQRQVIIA